MNPSDIQRLAKLLNDENDDSSSSEDDLPKTGYASLGPGDICKKIKIKGNEADYSSEKKMIEDPKNIWLLEEVQEVAVSDDILWDPRDKPVFDIKYKQALKTEDVYLQMTNKNATTASCEYLQISITMTGENKKDIDCNVTRTNLDIRSLKYRLNLPLPHPVDPDTAAADWDSSSELLIICLQMKRELDLINF